jgi:hypothetical protein
VYGNYDEVDHTRAEKYWWGDVAQGNSVFNAERCSTNAAMFFLSFFFF